MVYGKDNKLICLYFLNSSIFLTSTIFERGSPSLVGRGIANPMFERTRGFESHSPRLSWGVSTKSLKMRKRKILQRERQIWYTVD